MEELSDQDALTAALALLLRDRSANEIGTALASVISAKDTPEVIARWARASDQKDVYVMVEQVAHRRYYEEAKQAHWRQTAHYKLGRGEPSPQELYDARVGNMITDHFTEALLYGEALTGRMKSDKVAITATEQAVKAKAPTRWIDPEPWKGKRRR